MRKYLLILFILTVVLTVRGESVVKIYDQFDDNANEWYLNDTPDEKIEIADGKYIVENKNSSCGRIVYKDADIGDKDFYAEAAVKFESGRSDTGFGVFFQTDSGVRVHTLINQRGETTAYNEINDINTYYFNWTNYENLVKNDTWNVFKFKRENGKMAVTINDLEVLVFEPGIKIIRLGFNAGEMVKMSADYVKIEY